MCLFHQIIYPVRAKSCKRPQQQRHAEADGVVVALRSVVRLASPSVPGGDVAIRRDSKTSRNVADCVDLHHRIYEHTDGAACLRAV